MEATRRKGAEPPREIDEYRILRLLGHGRMGRVFLAQDTNLDRLVALKFIASVRPDERARRRFHVEGRALGRLVHPNVVAVYRVGEVNGHPYLVAEFIRGQTLAELPRPMPGERALQIGLGLARGLAAAHRQGVLHRDIKPANAMITPDGEVKLLDFGLAKLFAPSSDEDREDAPAEEPPSSARERAPIPSKRALPAGEDLTGAGGIIGTPLYMAPEVLRGAPASRRSDVYALGAVLYELCAGALPRPRPSEVGALDAWLATPPTPLAGHGRGTDPQLAAVIDRCLRDDPALRFASAEELRDALEQIEPEVSAGEVPEGNPYRGLAPFEPAHRALFFGRSAEISAVIDRLRAEPLVVVAGDSGVGKSSLCRAGVLPRIVEGALGDGRRYRIAALFPGSRPLAALAAVLSPLLDTPEAQLLAALRADPAALVGHVQQSLGRAGGAVLFIDQLEELHTTSDAEEAALLAETIGRLGALASGIRVLATVRGDFFTRTGALPVLGEELTRALYLLRPLSPEATREAIVGPARRTGVSFESEALVDELVEASGRASGGLPLLQFAMAELWEARDQARRCIPASALRALGGVGGALERHADGVIAALPAADREAARRVLVRLVTAEGTRARRTAEELGADGTAGAAIEALVRGRLVVARDAGGATIYEVAHEALIQSWGTLRGWLEVDGEKRRVRQRIEVATAEWERLGRAGEALFRERQLAETAAVEESELGPKETAFLRASRRMERRARWQRRALFAAIPLALAAVLGGIRLKTRHDLGELIAGHEAAGRAEMEQGERLGRDAAEQRLRSFSLFDEAGTRRGDEARALRKDAERLWASAMATSLQAERAIGGAARSFEAGLALDPGSAHLRGLIGDTYVARIVLAERFHAHERRRDLVDRLGFYDDGGARRRWLEAAPRLSVEAGPNGAEVSIERYQDEDGYRRPVSVGVLGRAPLVDLEVASGPGSYRLLLEAPGRAAVRLPLLLARGERAAVAVDLPPVEAVPEGYVYVPPGRFLYGSDDVEGLRRGMLSTQPLHEVRTGGYFIGRTEVTYGDWIAFLEGLPEEARDRHLPSTRNRQWGVSLARLPDGAWQLELVLNNERLAARQGERFIIPGRARRREQDWLRFPVTAISMADARGYMEWLDRTGRVRGARFCDEREWERAGRGADNRHYPHGDRLEPDDAAFDETYGRVTSAFGPDEVGSHPASESPFGLHDMTGSVYEWTLSAAGLGEVVVRSGAWYYDQIAVRVENRTAAEPNTRDYAVGLRVCADYPAR